MSLPIQVYFGLALGTTRQFSYRNKTYQYFYAKYNKTWMCERTVEIPIVLEYVKDFDSHAEILEVGNVLSHYST